VQHLTYKLKGNNVPMPSTLVKHLLRVFIPEIIQVGGWAGGWVGPLVGLLGGEGLGLPSLVRPRHCALPCWTVLPVALTNSPLLAAPACLPCLQRRLLPLFPKEFGEYMLAGGWVVWEGVWTGGGLRCQVASTCCSITGKCLHSAVVS
jgi:hypothetical protein